MNERVIAYREREAAKEKIKVGEPAPAFTLMDENGKPVSLSDFKGKWVMLDFWGTWCGWCVKGIPQMKEEYAKAGDNVVYVSIACNDPKDKWLEAIKKYEMNWVNLYSDNDTPAAEKVQTLYAIEGFPTKFLIDPEGNFAHICVGEQPSFYDDINAIINK
ncbi:MAG: TlpA family protein disulfide reductase [Paramuribaculum sp.]|nr:TlpA family protein disulfide reductase [Paramuribaculum sp.]